MQSIKLITSENCKATITWVGKLPFYVIHFAIQSAITQLKQVTLDVQCHCYQLPEGQWKQIIPDATQTIEYVT